MRKLFSLCVVVLSGCAPTTALDVGDTQNIIIRSNASNTACDIKQGGSQLFDKLKLPARVNVPVSTNPLMLDCFSPGYKPASVAVHYYTIENATVGQGVNVATAVGGVIPALIGGAIDGASGHVSETAKMYKSPIYIKLKPE